MVPDLLTNLAGIIMMKQNSGGIKLECDFQAADGPIRNLEISYHCSFAVSALASANVGRTDDGRACARADVQTNGCVWPGGCLRQIIYVNKTQTQHNKSILFFNFD